MWCGQAFAVNCQKKNTPERGNNTDLLAKTATVLFRDSLGHRHGRYTTGLSAADLPPCCVAGLSQILSDLGGLSRTSLSNHNQDLVVMNSLRWKKSTNKRSTYIYVYDP